MLRLTRVNVSKPGDGLVEVAALPRSMNGSPAMAPIRSPMTLGFPIAVDKGVWSPEGDYLPEGDRLLMSSQKFIRPNGVRHERRFGRCSLRRRRVHSRRTGSPWTGVRR